MAGAIVTSLTDIGSLYAQQTVPELTKSKGRVERLKQTNAARKAVYPNIIHFKHAKPTDLGLHPVAWQGKTVRLPQKPRQTVTPLNGTELWGNMVWAKGWDDSRAKYGIYSFLPQSPADFTPVHTDSLFYANGGGALVDGKYYFIERDDQAFILGRFKAKLYTYDADTWKQLEVVDLTEDQEKLITTETAVDNATGTIYAVFHDGYEDDKLGTIDYASKTRTVIGDLQRGYVALGITSDGKLYGIAEDGKLYGIDKSTAKELPIGDTGITVSDERGSYQQSGEIDQSTNTFYWASMDCDANAALYTVDLKTGKANLVASFPNGNQIYDMAIPHPYAAAGAPAQVADLAATYENGSTTGTISFTAPDKTFDGNALTSSQLDYTIVANSDTITGTTTPGQKVSVQKVLDEGVATIKAYTSNASGKGAESKLRKWIGLDTPDAVSNLNLVISDTTKAELTWDAPTEGIHEGYAGKLSYDVVRYPDSVSVAKGIITTSYTDVLPSKDTRTYTYGVKAKNEKYTSEEALSNKANGGIAYEVPYSNAFDSEDEFKAFTVINTNNDNQYGLDCTWAWNNDHFEWQTDFDPNVRYYPSQKNAADDWLISPAIHMKPNRTYKVSWTSSKYYSDKPEVLEIKAGIGLDPADMTTTVMKPTELSNNDAEDFTQEVAVPTEGNYNIGFHIISPANRSIFYIDDIKVEMGSEPGAPDSVTAVTITPDATGELKANVSLTAPTKSIDGNSIDKLTKIDVIRNNETVKTFTDVKAGETVSFVDENGIINGINEYSFVPYNSLGNGRKTSTSLFIGVDVPVAPTNVKLTDNGTSLSVSWDKVASKGPNDRVVNPDKVWYTIYNMSEGYSAGSYNSTPLDSTNTLSYTLGYNPDEVEPNAVLYGVSAGNIAGTSDVVPTNSIIIGKPATLPFIESFPCGRTDNWWWSQKKSYKGFEMVQNDASNGDMGCVQFQPYTKSEAKLNTCKISLKGAKRPVFSLDYYAYPGKDLQLALDIMRPDGSIERLGVINYAESTGTEGWKKAFINVDGKYTSDRYDIFMLYAYNNDTDYPIKADNIRLADFKDVDAEITSFKYPSKLIKGHPAHIDFTVMNTGLNGLGEYDVITETYGEPNDEYEEDTLSSLASKKFSIDVNPSVLDKSDELKLSIRIEKDGVLLADTTGIIKLEDSERAPVKDLAIETIDGSKNLTWTAPESSEVSYTETFESYDPWSTAFGEWQNIDKDDGAAGSISGSLMYKGQDDSLSYLVFNPEDLDKGLIYNTPNLAAHDGNQYLAAIYSVDYTRYWDPQYMNTNDWLISPKLSGKAQTISFYANYQKNTDNYGNPVDSYESYTVLYSTTDADSASFKVLTSDTLRQQGWTEKDYNLPDGTQYFAIVHNTPAGEGFMFLLDDITFKKAGGTPQWYYVYADGKKFAQVNAKEYTRCDISSLANVNELAVTAVYDDLMESEPAYLDLTSGINSIITNDGTTRGNTYTISGMRIPEGKKLPAGVYIINGKKYTVKH